MKVKSTEFQWMNLTNSNAERPRIFRFWFLKFLLLLLFIILWLSCRIVCHPHAPAALPAAKYLRVRQSWAPLSSAQVPKRAGLELFGVRGVRVMSADEQQKLKVSETHLLKQSMFWDQSSFEIEFSRFQIWFLLSDLTLYVFYFQMEIDTEARVSRDLHGRRSNKLKISLRIFDPQEIEIWRWHFSVRRARTSSK